MSNKVLLIEQAGAGWHEPPLPASSRFELICASEVEAVEVLQQRGPEFSLLVVSMPLDTALGFIRYLQFTPCLEVPPILVLTPHTDGAQCAESRRIVEQAASLAEKPFDPRSFMRLVETRAGLPS